MVYYKAYVQLTFKDILVVVTNERNKNQVVIIDSFQMDIGDYINENGAVQFPLVLAEDVAKKLNNNNKYSVKDITLILSPKDTIVTTVQENIILNPKELVEFAKTKIDGAFKKHPEAYEMAWLHTGNILDDGAPYSIFVQYCYPLREINKLKKAFQKNRINVSEVLLPELATAALFLQYYDEFNDPTTLIVESGYISSPNSMTTTYWFKRNVLENIGSLKAGIFSIVREISNTYTHLTHQDIITLMLSCGVFKEYPTSDADEILTMNGIEKDEWFAITTRAFHNFATTLRNDIQRHTERPDTIVLTGILACIPGIKEYLYYTYSIVADIWENKFDMKIEQTSFLYTNSTTMSPIFATVMGAIYCKYWTKGMKKGTLSKPIFEININAYNKYLITALIASLLYSGYLFLPGFIKLKQLQAEHEQIIAEEKTTQQIQLNIDKYKQNIETQKQFIEKSQKTFFDVREFMFNAILLKPDEITIISIDTPNYIEKVADTKPYYYIRKAVEHKLGNLNVSNNTSYTNKEQQGLVDIGSKDWTFGLDWENVPLTTEGIEKYLAENNIVNVAPYLVTKVVIRGYGSQYKIATYADDLNGIKSVHGVDIVAAEEKKVPDGAGSVVTSNVFEINVWFKEEVDNDDTENTN